MPDVGTSKAGKSAAEVRSDLKSSAFILLFIGVFAGSTIAQSKPQPILVDVISSSRSAKATNARPRTVNCCEAPASANVLEQRTFELMNAERISKGLKVLAWDEQMASLARRHSQNMAAAKFFSHRGSDGTMVDDRAAILGIFNWHAIGENIAFMRGQDDPAAMAVEKWMQSTSHKKNILNAHWSESAIGVTVTPDGTAYFTQVFIAR